MKTIRAEVGKLALSLASPMLGNPLGVWNKCPLLWLPCGPREFPHPFPTMSQHSAWALDVCSCICHGFVQSIFPPGMCPSSLDVFKFHFFFGLWFNLSPQRFIISCYATGFFFFSVNYAYHILFRWFFQPDAYGLLETEETRDSLIPHIFKTNVAILKFVFYFSYLLFILFLIK